VKYVRAFVVALFATAMIASTLAPANAEAPRRGTTFLVGDSTAWRLTGEYDGRVNLLRQYDLDWNIDAVGGRTLLALPTRIVWYLRNVDSAPETFVMALGTNPYPGWEKVHYELCLALLPRDTKVVLVTPAVFGSRWAKSKITRRHARWLAEIAADRPNTVLANWRQKVQRSNPDPTTGKSRLLAEGIHQTPVTGRRVWLDLVVAKVDQLD
jgi:hypothetical protein